MTLLFMPLSKFTRPVRWGILVFLSALFGTFLTAIYLPAALLLGAIVAGILVETCQAEIQLPKFPFHISQGIIGCLVANSLTLEIVHSFIHQWPVFLAIVLIIIVSCCTLGWAMSKRGILPGTTAIWGLLPGAASAMMLMSDAFGADSRLVAFMQYLRVVLVVAIASLVAHFWVHASVIPAPIVWFPVIHWLPFLETLAIILA